MRDTFSNLLYHLILSTECSSPAPDFSCGSELHAEFADVLRNLGGELVVAGGTNDHIHLLAELPANITVADAAQRVRHESAARVERALSNGKTFRWKRIDALFSVSAATGYALAAYIRNQQEHHRICSFEEELREFAGRERMPQASA
jgi:REP element-mobilizing transposase RayT